jgi:broad specificity phosphatase PhoE
MSLFYLIRHGDHHWLPRGIAGRIPGVHLNANGKKQVEELAERLAKAKFDAIYSSPLERAVESAEPLAKKTGLEIKMAPEIIELNFGDWNGKTFDQLNADPRWADWNRHRSVVRMPGGETMIEVQSRVVAFISKLHDQQPNATFALFSHGDSIRAALCHWLGMPLDLLPRVDLKPASVCILKLEGDAPSVVAINNSL